VGVALFEAVTGRFLNGDPVTDAGGDAARLQSVMDHLTRLFNTRRGSIPHDPEYGLPDIGEVYQHMPNSLLGFRRILVDVARRYEPRIDSVDCRVEQVSTEEFRLQAVLTARLVQGRSVRVRAVFSSAGRAEVAQAPRRA
jgi:type VI secretion system protein